MLMNLISCISDLAFVFLLYLYLSIKKKRITTNFSRFLSFFQSLSVDTHNNEKYLIRLNLCRKIKRPFPIPRLNFTVHRLIAIHRVNKMSTFFVLPSGSIRYTYFLESGFITKKVVQVSWNFQMIHLESEQDMSLSTKNKMVLLRVF